MQDRLISAFIYGLAGIFLGLLITVAWAPYFDINTRPVATILKITLLCAFIGFLFPHHIQRLFTWVWKFFSN
ncbi:hypothetical protein [Acinetobacter courvalinii]|uniref:hypothetical protein n=1 Tax=Acinetobacter courvalinii TaxID=280147 RepID=UPI00289EB0F0|nr:hypothetical protein [Acinetobacter courvalinii]